MMAPAKGPEDVDPGEGKYIYCIIGCEGEPTFGPMGIGGRGDEVYTVAHQGVGAVVSHSPLKKYPITREFTMAHQKVMEKVMKDHPLLPVRFDTIAEGTDGTTDVQRIKRQVLQERQTELQELLKKMKGKTELGLKALWVDMGPIYSEIVAENEEIRRLRNRIQAKPPVKTHDAQVELGRRVKEALEAKKRREEQEVLDELTGLFSDLRKGRVLGDGMVTNLSFLVQEDRCLEFDERVDALSQRLVGRTRMRYIGPVPPCNFVELVIKWN